MSNPKAITAGDGIDKAIDASGGNNIVVVIIQWKLNYKDNNVLFKMFDALHSGVMYHV